MSLLLLDTVSPSINEDKLRTWPRAGISISVILNPRHNRKEIVKIYQDCGVTLTDTNYLASAWGNPANVMPFWQLSDGRWDLFKWREEYFDRVQETREMFNAAGIVMQGALLETYSISIRKSSTEYLSRSPWRHNVNGIAWGVPVDGQTEKKADALMFAKTIPDEWCEAFIANLAPRCRWDLNPVRIGNEFPEKPLHYRVRDLIKKYVPNALTTVNRNEDTPGQWANMKMGKGDFDFLEYHGRLLKSIKPVKDDSGRVAWPLGDLDRPYPDSKSSMLPTASFAELLDAPQVDKRKLIFSSDGARIGDDPIDTYNWVQLKEFFRYVRGKGCSIVHQSRAKMTEEPNQHMIEAEWFQSVIA